MSILPPKYVVAQDDADFDRALSRVLAIAHAWETRASARIPSNAQPALLNAIGKARLKHYKVMKRHLANLRQCYVVSASSNSPIRQPREATIDRLERRIKARAYEPSWLIKIRDHEDAVRTWFKNGQPEQQRSDLSTQLQSIAQTHLYDIPDHVKQTRIAVVESLRLPHPQKRAASFARKELAR